MMKINADLCRDTIIKEMQPKFTFDENKDYAEQKKAVKEKLFELLGMDKMQLNACKENMIIESQEEKDGYKQIRLVYESEKRRYKRDSVL